MDLDNNEDDQSIHQVALMLETRLVKSKDITSISFKWTDDPNAPTIVVSEEDALKNYPWIYKILVEKLSRRYGNFSVNREFHKLKDEFREEKKYSILRFLDPGNPNSSNTRRYNPNILKEFDKHYIKRKKR